MFSKMKWLNPLKIANNISLDKNYKDNWVFLYSGLHKDIKNSKSYIALYPKKEFIFNNFNIIELKQKDINFGLFGYFGYDLKSSIENLPKDKEYKIKSDEGYLINFNLVIEFNHKSKKINYFYSQNSYLEQFYKNYFQNNKILTNKIIASDLESNFNKNQYLEKVSYIKDRIIEGDLYQANLTRKFNGKIKVDNNFDIFLKLNKESPGNYSSFMKLKENYIISSSPELFLNINNKGQIKSSPIKGTAPRATKDKIKDLESKRHLKNCRKELSENLMIVDLVRNDLSKSCKAGSIKVKNLFKINSYKTVHHMSSDVIGKIDRKFNNIDVVKNAFPPASMTGTPKIKAMELCSNLELVKRGIYSGSIGFISQKKCKLSVVIRTLIVNKNNFEFQVGGAITHGSNPYKEWLETIQKAKGILKSININLKKIKKI
ncbi:anthranilate synthase component I family protein [Rickettsiales bacterium]|nr:anthranilate synthase component I family protein [Rickettsiales bacterium]